MQVAPAPLGCDASSDVVKTTGLGQLEQKIEIEIGIEKRTVVPVVIDKIKISI